MLLFSYSQQTAVSSDVVRIFLFVRCPVSYCRPGSSVGIATGYGLDGPGIESLRGRDFPHLSRLGPAQPHVQWVPGLSRGERAAGA